MCVACVCVCVCGVQLQAASKVHTFGIVLQLTNEDVASHHGVDLGFAVAMVRCGTLLCFSLSLSRSLSFTHHLYLLAHVCGIACVNFLLCGLSS